MFVLYNVNVTLNFVSLKSIKCIRSYLKLMVKVSVKTNSFFQVIKTVKIQLNLTSSHDVTIIVIRLLLIVRFVYSTHKAVSNASTL